MVKAMGNPHGRGAVAESDGWERAGNEIYWKIVEKGRGGSGPLGRMWRRMWAQDA